MNEQLFYAQEINTSRFFAITKISERGRITESSDKKEWLKLSKKDWEQLKGIENSNFDVDFELVAAK
jgi:hypothetical protein